jgi:hypothetical protein
VKGPCKVVDGRCLAPANVEGVEDVRVCTCYGCGDAVCRNCSSVTRTYETGKRVRICNGCVDDIGLAKVAKGGK